MPFISKINFTVIAYITEDIDLVKQCLLNCFPEDMRDIPIQRQILQSQFKDRLVIMSATIDNKKQMKKLLSYLAANIENKEYIRENFENMYDEFEKSLHVRLNKFRALDGYLEISTGSDVIKCTFRYTTYSKKENEWDEVVNMFLKAGLVE